MGIGVIKTTCIASKFSLLRSICFFNSRVGLGLLSLGLSPLLGLLLLHFLLCLPTSISHFEAAVSLVARHATEGAVL